MDLKIIMLVVFVAVMLGIGLYSRKKVKSSNDFLIGGRGLGPWISAFSYGTTYFSAVIFIGYAGKTGWQYGLSAAWVGIGNAVIGSLLAWIILAKRTREMTQRFNVSTMPGLFEKRYDSKWLKICAALVIFVFMVPYSASVYSGLSYLFESVFNVPYVYCVVTMAILTGLYLLLGGFIASALNDFVQGIIMLVGIISVVVLVVCHTNVGGVMTGAERLQAIDANLAAPFGGDIIGLVSLVLLTSLGTWGLPQMAQKYYAIKDNKSIKIATIVSSIFALIIAGGSYFMGGFGRLFVSPDEITMANGALNFDMVVPKMITAALPEFMMGLVTLLVLSASMSTLASLVLVSSSAVSVDLVKTFKPDMKDKKVVGLLRVMCIVFVGISVWVALIPSGIVTLMSYSWGTLAGAFIAPYMFGLFWKKTTKAGAWAGFIAGLGTSVTLIILTNTVLKVAWLTPPTMGVLSMAAGLIALPIVSLMTQNSKKLSYIESLEGKGEVAE